MLASGGGLTLLLDDTRHFLTLGLGADVGTKTLLEEAEATLVYSLKKNFATSVLEVGCTCRKRYINFYVFYKILLQRYIPNSPLKICTNKHYVCLICMGSFLYKKRVLVMIKKNSVYLLRKKMELDKVST